MFTDTYKFEDIEDAFYMVIGKNTTVTEGNIELDGANPSAEEADEGTESTSQSGIDVVLFMRLQETGFGNKKDYLTYMKGYLKRLVLCKPYKSAFFYLHNTGANNANILRENVYTRQAIIFSNLNSFPVGQQHSQSLGVKLQCKGHSIQVTHMLN